jgi:cobalt-zinc-cadmium efflux system outer membrane protein
LVSGCSKIPPSDDGFVSCTIANKIGSEVEWSQGYCRDEKVDDFIENAIAHELTADKAIQIALLNNPKVQVLFEELGIARADLVEAGLLSNPSFEIEVRYPHIKGLKTNIEYLLTSSLLDIFLIPLRTRLAKTEFYQTKLQISNEILDLAFDVRKTFYELIAERKKIQYIQSVIELTSIIREISSKQLAIGNVNLLQFQLAQARFLEAELELARSEAETIRLKEKLHKLLGLSDPICLIFPPNLPEVDYYGFDLCLLESIALQERLDLQIARSEITRLNQMLGLKDWWTYTYLRLGLAGEREPGGANLMGPGFSGELPIFNYGQAARMRLFAQLRQAQNYLIEMEIKVLTEVREAHELLMSYLQIIKEYQLHLLPIQDKISATSQELYNVMGLGIDQLLENKRLEIVASQNYTESLKKYLTTRVELDRALGGNLFQLFSKMEYAEGANP